MFTTSGFPILSPPTPNSVRCAFSAVEPSSKTNLAYPQFVKRVPKNINHHNFPWRKGLTSAVIKTSPILHQVMQEGPMCNQRNGFFRARKEPTTQPLRPLSDSRQLRRIFALLSWLEPLTSSSQSKSCSQVGPSHTLLHHPSSTRPKSSLARSASEINPRICVFNSAASKPTSHPFPLISCASGTRTNLPSLPSVGKLSSAVCMALFRGEDITTSISSCAGKLACRFMHCERPRGVSAASRRWWEFYAVSIHVIFRVDDVLWCCAGLRRDGLGRVPEAFLTKLRTSNWFEKKVEKEQI